MAIADIICTYMYGTFLALKTSLEVIVKYAKTIINTIDSTVKSIEVMIVNVLDITADAMIKGLKILCKKLTDLLLPFDIQNSKLCTSLYKCSFILQDILNPNSTITKTLVKYTDVGETVQEIEEQLYDLVGDYNEFKKQICNFGFTFELGIATAKGWIEDAKKWTKSQIAKITRYRTKIVTMLQKYLDSIIDLGIADLLGKLQSLFNCVLFDSVDSCATLATSNSFYRWCTGTLHIESIGHNEFQMKPSWVESKLSTVDSFNLKVKQIDDKLSQTLEAMLVTNNIGSATNAYNLASLIKQFGNLRIQDGKIVGWKKIKFINRITTTYDNIIKAIKDYNDANNHEIDVTDNNYSVDNILNNTRINEINGTITFKNVDITNYANPEIEVVDDDVLIDAKTDIDSFGRVILDGQGNIISSSRAAYSIFLVTNGFPVSEYDMSIYNLCKKYALTFTEYIDPKNMLNKS